MKKRNITCFLFSSILICMVGSSEVQAEETQSVNVDYASIYETIATGIYEPIYEKDSISADYLEYALYDIDGDGYKELLIQNGTNNANMMFEVYTTDGLSAIYLGDTGGNVTLFENPQGMGVYTYYGKDSYEDVELLTVENGMLSQSTVFTTEAGAVMPPNTLGDKIPTRYVKDGITEDTEYVFPDSDKRYLTEEEVRSVSKDQLAYGRNEIFARHGYIFKESPFPEYFQSKSWYHGTVTGDQFDSSVFNEYESANIDLILRIENEDQNQMQAVSSVNYNGGYIDGTDDDSNYIVITQSGNQLSYTWTAGGETLYSESNLTINADGSVVGEYWDFWLENTSTLKVAAGSNIFTFWKVN